MHNLCDILNERQVLVARDICFNSARAILFVWFKLNHSEFKKKKKNTTADNHTERSHKLIIPLEFFYYTYKFDPQKKILYLHHSSFFFRYLNVASTEVKVKFI